MHVVGGKSPRGHLPLGENPHPTNRVTFSDTCEYALHLKSSNRELVVDEKAPSNLARAGDAVRPAQLLRHRRHHGRARGRDLVSLPPRLARARMDVDRRVHHEGSALESLARVFPGPEHAGGPGPLRDALRGRHPHARADSPEDLRRRGDRDLAGRAAPRRPELPRQSAAPGSPGRADRSEEHTSELQSLRHLVCRLLLEKKKYTAWK